MQLKLSSLSMKCYGATSSAVLFHSSICFSIVYKMKFGILGLALTRKDIPDSFHISLRYSSLEVLTGKWFFCC